MSDPDQTNQFFCPHCGKTVWNRLGKKSAPKESGEGRFIWYRATVKDGIEAYEIARYGYGRCWDGDGRELSPSGWFFSLTEAKDWYNQSVQMLKIRRDKKWGNPSFDDRAVKIWELRRDGLTLREAGEVVGIHAGRADSIDSKTLRRVKVYLKHHYPELNYSNRDLRKLDLRACDTWAQQLAVGSETTPDYN